MAFKLTGRHDQKPPLITCRLSHDDDRWRGNGPPPSVCLKALIDTGATHLVTTPAIVASLNLPFVRNINNVVVGGTNLCRAYACKLTLRGVETNTECSMDSHVTDALILEQDLSGYDLIIGWDALRFYDLTFSRDGSFTLVGHD